MPLHDWTDDRAWEDVHSLWPGEIFRLLKARLPEPYRASLSTTPALGVGAGPTRPDVSVRDGHGPAAPPAAGGDAPDEEVAVATLELTRTVLVSRRGTLVAAVELVSPRNKDRPEARDAMRNRCAGYLLHGVHLMVVDVHPRPAGFSLPDAVAAALGFVATPTPAPCAAVYRVGALAPEVGRYLGLWRRPLTVGGPLPTLPLPLTAELSVPVDLEATYARAAADAYLE